MRSERWTSYLLSIELISILARPQFQWQCLIVCFSFSHFLTRWTRGSFINRPSSCSVLYTTTPTAHPVQERPVLSKELLSLGVKGDDSEMVEFKRMNNLSLRKLNYMATYRRINVGRQSATGIVQYHRYVCVIVSIPARTRPCCLHSFQDQLPTSTRTALP